MTRQKKEIIKRIDYLHEMIEVDSQLGCGFAPADAYLSTYEEIDRLWEELAHLRHYKDGMEMQYDERGDDSLLRRHRDTIPLKQKTHSNQGIGKSPVLF